MSITTKTGDGGMTALMDLKNVPKSDVRIGLLGNIDELTSNIGLVKAEIGLPKVKEMLTEIQKNLIIVMAGVAEPRNEKHRLKEEDINHLEEQMAEMEQKFTLPEGWALPGDTVLSAQIDVTRTVARRCERKLAAVTMKFGTDQKTRQYLNRLSDYLFILARYAETLGDSKTGKRGETLIDDKTKLEQLEDAVAREVMRYIGKPARLTLKTAKELIDKVEQYACSQGKKAVIAVAGADGNPIAVHVMDDSFLVSFDVAVKKAYTAAAVKMSTKELGELIKVGNTFQGLDKIQADKMVFFGGGVPLMSEGELVGALGVSGGTGEEDDEIAVYGLKVFESL